MAGIIASSTELTPIEEGRERAPATDRQVDRQTNRQRPKAGASKHMFPYVYVQDAVLLFLSALLLQTVSSYQVTGLHSIPWDD